MAQRKKAARRARKPASGIQAAAHRLTRTWNDTREALGTAEASVEKQVKALVKKSGVDTRRATEALKAWRTRAEKERRRATREVEARLAALQSRAKKERKVVARMVDDAVQGALAALNIPSRQEVHGLTRRVEELSRRIDGFHRAAARPRRATARTTT